MKEVILKDKEWIHSKEVYVRGHMFRDGKIIKGKDLLQVVSLLTPDSIDDFLSTTDGFFSFVINRLNYSIVCVDHIRIYPMFYNVATRTISDTIDYRTIEEAGIDVEVYQQYRMGFFCIGNSTIANNWIQIEAGNYLLLEKENQMYRKYWSYHYPKNQITDEKKALDMLCASFHLTINKLIDYLDGRTAIIPLSGGHDSRIILFLLKEHGYKNIITYTYGSRDYPEVITASNIAKKLNVQIYFIEYIPQKMKELFYSDYRKMMEYHCNASSIPHLQDWYAVYELINKYNIPEDSVFIPGHSGDMLAGEQFAPIHAMGEEVSKTTLIEMIAKKHLVNCPQHLSGWRNDYILCKCKYLDRKDLYTRVEAEELYERFFWEERDAKYICNSMRTYSYYGYDICCPLNYKEQVEVWEHISNELRADRIILFKLEKELYKGSNIEGIPFVAVEKRKSRISSFVYKVFHRPIKTHYMFGYLNISLIDYYMLLFRHRFKDVFFFMQDYYVNEFVKEKLDLFY